MKPCILVVHIATSSLARWKANIMLLYLRRETSDSQSDVTKCTEGPHQQHSSQSIYCGRRESLQTMCTHARMSTHTHNRHHTKLRYGYTHSYTANLISSGRNPYTHTNTCINHQPPHPRTLSYTSNRYIHSTPNQTDCQAGSHDFDPDGKW